MDRRVVVTGMGMVTPLGVGKDRFREALWRGETGIREIAAFPTDGFGSHLGAEIRAFQPRDFISLKNLRKMDRLSAMTTASVRMALDDAGIPVQRFEARDGLASINGSNCISGMGAVEIVDALQWLRHCDIATAMTLEVVNANMLAYDDRVHRIRGFSGAIEVAANVRKVTDGSEMLRQKGKKVQDAYSLRSTPQVAGAAREALQYARSQIETELNGVGDNPLFFPDDDGGTILTGANFQGTPMALGLETLGTAVTTVCVLSERRLNRLLNRNLSCGLPAFLTKGAGMFSGLMLSQYTADTLVVEQRILSAPACIQSIPAAADQEDFVSMGMNGALKTLQILDNAEAIVGIELMAAAQALDFRDFEFGRGTRAAHDAVRAVVAHLDEDRPLYADHNAMHCLVKRCDVLAAVEAEVGELGSSWASRL